ncbi:hypothetical protein FSP39_000578 [Pinctada imbricata]|uniref:Uncharacterized protein n=1 Tax=Pinctada imbricata TaxID=66713 RepID=A0AA89BUG1_PINIB|nr:hypothetical protein FSP39_000578 [Pinctada imbricata]
MATNTKLMQEISDQFLHCKICLEPYKEPKTLICLHSFCMDCIQQHVDSEGSRSRYSSLYNRHVTCPLCRKRTELPAGGVRRLPDNFLLSNLTEVIDRRRPSKIPPCEICHTVRTRSNEACSKCLDCSKLLCRTCVELHQNTKVTQNHSIIDVEGEKDIVCKQHQDEIVRFYCEPCDTCICVVCTFQEHRDHEICSFSDGFIKYKKDMETLLTDCKQRQDEVQDRLQMMNNCESVLKETRENIRDLAISYIQQVRTTERELLKTVDTYLGDKVLDFIQSKEWLEENLEGLQSACHLTDIIMRDKGVEMLLLKKQMQNKLNSLLEKNLPQLPDDLKKPLKFIPGDVKFGTLSFNDTSDENDNEKDVSFLNGISTKTQEIQTNQTEFKDSCTTMLKDVTFKTKERRIQTEKMIHKEMGTEPIPMKEKCTLTIQNKCKTQGSMTESDLTLDKSPKIANMQEKGQQVFSDVGTPGSGICVSCCQNIQSEANLAASNFEKSPNVQDIIVLNTTERNEKEWRKHRRSLIKSRRVQTDVSMSNDSLDESNLVPARSLSYEGVINQYKPEMKTVALDPVGFPEESTVKKPVCRNKGTETTFQVKIVAPTKNASTATIPPRKRDFSQIPKPEAIATSSQTLRNSTSTKSVATDYAGQSEKATSTVPKTLMDSETSMPVVHFATKDTWTDILQTCERAMATEGPLTCDTATVMEHVSSTDQAIQMQPITIETGTNTLPPKSKGDGKTTVAEDEKDGNLNENRKSWHGSGIFSKLFRRSKDGKGSSDGLNQSQSDISDFASPPLSPFRVDASTETLIVLSADKETGTDAVAQSDRWTLTPQPILINTGVCPARPATRDTGVETNVLSSMDQGTYTEVVNTKDTATETIHVIQDNETLTDKVKLSDAQTFTECSTNTCETNTDHKAMVDSFMSTDDDWFEKCKPERRSASTETLLSETKESACNTQTVISANQSTNITLDEIGVYVDSSTNPVLPDTQDRGTMALSFGQTSSSLSDTETQTPEVDCIDKSAATSFEYLDEKRPIELCDMATSTESLPYIGLLSELDGDELFLIPESAFDMATPEHSIIDENGEPVEMIDGGTSTEFVDMVEESTQTPGSSVLIERDLDEEDDERSKTPRHVDGKELVDIGVNTAPKLTFEKETTTPIRHLFSKGTMTFYIAKTDKSTCTFSNTRQIAESIFGGHQHQHVDKSNKVTMTREADMADASTSTDSALLEGKMAACITKLRNVSERLQSPTSKTMPEAPWNEKQTSEKVMDTLSPKGIKPEPHRSPQIKRPVSPKHKKDGRKAQPITTLKGKSLAPPEVNEKSKSLPREGDKGKEGEYKPAMSPSLQSKLPRYNSAPGRIVTVPNQSMKIKQSQATTKLPPSKIPVHRSNEGTLNQTPSPVTRPKTPNIQITEPSDQQTTKQRKDIDHQNDIQAAKAFPPSSGMDMGLDFSSFRIPQKATPSLPPLPPLLDEEVTEVAKAEMKKEDPKKKQQPAADKKAGSNVGFMQKLFSKKKKTPDISPQKAESRANVPKQFPKPNYLPPEKKPQKPYKPRPFVYLRQRIVSIQHDNEDDKPTTSSDNVEDQRSALLDDHTESGDDSRPVSTYDN